MCNTIARINDCTGEFLRLLFFGNPGRANSENSLNSNIKTWDVEGLEHDFSKCFSVFWGIERRFSLKELKEGKKKKLLIKKK